jgi:autotransporter-associated beta strand protein
MVVVALAARRHATMAPREQANGAGGVTATGTCARLAGALLLALTSLCTPAAAQTNWQTTGTASWFTAGNWSAGVPNSATAAVVDLLGGTAQILTGAGIAFASTLTIGGGGTVELKGGGASLVTPSIDLTTGGTLLLTQTLAVGLAVTDPVTLDGGTIQGGGLVTGNQIFVTNKVTLNPGGGKIDAATQELVVSGNIVDGSGTPGTLTIASTGLPGVTLSGNNTYSGPTLVGSNALLMTQPLAGTGLSPNSDFTVNGGLMVGNGGGTIRSLSGTGSVVLGSSSFSIAPPSGSFTFSGVISDIGAGYPLTKAGAGTQILAGANTYRGGTILSGGELSVSSDANLGDPAGGLTFNGGILQVTGTSFNSTPRTMTWGPKGGGFDIAAAANSFTVAQTLTGTGSLTKLGAGTLVLPNANTYSGGTTISAGILQIGKNTALGSGPVTLDGGTLQAGASFGAINPVANNIVLNPGGGALDAAAQNLTLSGNITNGSGTPGTLTITSTGGPFGGAVQLSGNNTYSGPTLVTGTAALLAFSTTALSPNSDFTVNGAILLIGRCADARGHAERDECRRLRAGLLPHPQLWRRAHR